VVSLKRHNPEKRSALRSVCILLGPIFEVSVYYVRHCGHDTLLSVNDPSFFGLRLCGFE
jgi:hypothetical protein